jgi:hypothetical protein
MVVHGGMQSHCGMLASNTREFSFADVKSNFLLATCTFCTGYYAKFLGDETCHICCSGMYVNEQSSEG